jgi:hypothetical protein
MTIDRQVLIFKLHLSAIWLILAVAFAALMVS